MKSINRNLKNLGVLLVIGFALYINMKDDSGDEFVSNFRMRKIQGDIMERYVDTLNHLNKTIVIKDEEGNVETLVINGDESEFFKESEIGDTITKNENDLHMIINPGSDRKEFIISFTY